MPSQLELPASFMFAWHKKVETNPHLPSTTTRDPKVRARQLADDTACQREAGAALGRPGGGLGVGGGGFSRRRRRAYCTYSADERERDLTWSPEDLLISSPTSVLLMQEGIRMRWWVGRVGRWAGGRKKTKKKERPSSDHLLSAATAPVRTDVGCQL